MFLKEFNIFPIKTKYYQVSPGEPSQLVPVGGHQSLKRMTDDDKLDRLVVNLLPELESCRGREQVGDLGVQVPLLGVGGAVRELEVVDQPRGGGRLEDRAVQEPLGNSPSR